MKYFICDASVVLKWFHQEGEAEVEAAALVLDAHVNRLIDIHVIELTYYEIGNIMTSKLQFNPEQVEQALLELSNLVGLGIGLTKDVWTLVGEQTVEHGLTFYDAAYLAIAEFNKAKLISADRALLAAGAISATDVAATLEDPAD